MTLLTRGLLANGHSVTVITLYNEDTDFFILPKAAERLALGIDGISTTVIHGLANNLQRLRILRRAIKSSQPDVVVSHIHQTNVMTIIALGGTAVPMIAVEHNDPGMHPAGRIWEALRRRTYPRAWKLVSVSRGVDEGFSWLAADKRIVIHNPIELPKDVQAISVPDTEIGDRQWIAAMGRLTPQKGFDLLLQAFAKVVDRHPGWGLRIIGEGELRRELEQLSAQLDLSQSVSFAGLLANPLPVLRNSKLFAMASRYEGFPYAALEAMACGLPVIYTDCPSGPREIIREGVDGLLVPNGDVAALAAAMDRLMSNSVERANLAARAPQVLDRFGTAGIVAQWEDLFEASMK
ncbi:MAG: glycosyl transferase group 1 [Acidobacteria bacterium]|nr:glycosyl transferase group 1 [Acidobacteriota bacterium]